MPVIERELVRRSTACDASGVDEDVGNAVRGRDFSIPFVQLRIVVQIERAGFGVAAFSVLREAAGGEELVVVVELRRRPEGDVASRIRGRLSEVLGVMADRIELVGAGDLPRTTSGKLRRAECIARFGGRA